MPRAAKYSVGLLRRYTRAALKHASNVFICIYVILFPFAATLIIPSTGRLSRATDPRIMNETKKDEVMQVEDTSDALVCRLTLNEPFP